MLRTLLLFFEAESGLKVELSKSELVPVGNVCNIQLLAITLGCKVSSFPMKYLGFPLGAASRVKSISDVVIEKIEHKLASWKMLYLLKGSRIT